jgi:DNA segregation ATPase FtsK/SpoIIIE-like protein
MMDLKDLERKYKELDKRLNKIENRLAPPIFPVDSNGRDELYKKAKALVVENDLASASFLQRKLLIGYARAARILDELQAGKVVGPALGATPRKILIKKSKSRR